MDEWDFQGEVAYTNLSANVQAYAFPTEILKIKRLEIDYNDNGKYVPADQIDSTTIRSSIATSAEINAKFTTADPKFDAWAHSAFLYPVPDAAVNSGLAIWHENNVTQFTAVTAQNTAEPAFDRPFHRILSLGAALDYAKKYQMAELMAFCERELYGTTSTRQGRVGGLITKLRKHYGTRSADKIVQLKSRYYDINYK